MNDDGRLVGALVQGNEVILHHAPELPAYRWTVETLASAACAAQDSGRAIRATRSRPARQSQTCIGITAPDLSSPSDPLSAMAESEADVVDITNDWQAVWWISES